MKTIQLRNEAGTIDMRYLVDLISDTREFTVFQISNVVSGVETLGPSTLAIQGGWFIDILETSNLYAFKQFAINNNLKMDILETGQTTVQEYYPGNFLTYSMAEQTGAATIDTDNQTIAIEVANGTTVTALVATFTLSTGASAVVGSTAQVSATTANNFTSPVEYIVTHASGETTTWTVTVTVAAS